MPPAATTESRASKRSARGDSSSRRMALAAPTDDAATATGLTAIQAISPAGNVDSAPGCAQYEEIDSVEAQAKAAAPPGTRP